MNEIYSFTCLWKSCFEVRIVCKWYHVQKGSVFVNYFFPATELELMSYTFSMPVLLFHPTDFSKTEFI